MAARRYFRGLGAGIYTYFSANVVTGSTSSTQSYNTTIKGVPAAVVTVKVTTYIASDPGAAVYELNSITHVLNDTINLTLGADGTNTFTQLLNVGTSTPGNGLEIILTIESVTSGLIGSINTQQNSYTT